jgi:hypothetical protein
MVLNPSFEDGLTDWQTVGTVATAGSAYSPTEGSSAVVITSGAASALFADWVGFGLPLLTGGTSITDPSHPQYQAPLHGSLITQELIFEGTGFLRFDWNAYSRNAGQATIGGLSLTPLGGGPNTMIGFGEIEDGTSVLQAVDGWTYQRGWSSYFLDVRQAGTYRLTVGILDFGAEVGANAVAIDNLRFDPFTFPTQPDGTAVPDTATTLPLLGIALAGCLAFRRRIAA